MIQRSVMAGELKAVFFLFSGYLQCIERTKFLRESFPEVDAR